MAINTDGQSAQSSGSHGDVPLNNAPYDKIKRRRPEESSWWIGSHTMSHHTNGQRGCCGALTDIERACAKYKGNWLTETNLGLRWSHAGPLNWLFPVGRIGPRCAFLSSVIRLSLFYLCVCVCKGKNKTVRPQIRFHCWHFSFVFLCTFESVGSTPIALST